MPNPCINDGFCAEDKANEKGYMCICKQGFTGNRCHSKCGGDPTYLRAILNWKHAAQSDPVESSENAFGSRGITIGGERVFAFLLACVKGSPLTHVKISQLVASLQTSRQQVVFAWLVTSCQQV